MISSNDLLAEYLATVNTSGSIILLRKYVSFSPMRLRMAIRHLSQYSQKIYKTLLTAANSDEILLNRGLWPMQRRF